MGTLTHLIKQHAVGILALFIALGGTSYASATIAANSITSKQIKNRSVRTADLAPSARGIAPAKLSQAVADTMDSTEVLSALRGAVKGEKGDKGDTGPAGEAVAGPAGPTGEQGTQGTQGPQGPRGAPGATSAFGNVKADGSAELYNAGTFDAVQRPAGVYCLSTEKAAVPNPRVAVVTISAGTSSSHASVRKAPTSGFCDGRDFEVTTYEGTELADHDFAVVILGN